jgi:hypothetical protein
VRPISAQVNFLANGLVFRGKVKGDEEKLVLVREEDVLGTKASEMAMHWSIDSKLEREIRVH